MANVKLGDEVIDTVSNFKGIVIAITEWIHQCKRISVQPKVGKDGTLPDTQAFDEPALKVIKSKKKVKKIKTGGIKPMVTQSKLII